MKIIETHAHLDFETFDGDRDQVMERARQVGVEGIINVAIHPDVAPRTLELCRRYPEVQAAVGIHPHEAGRYRDRLDEAMTALRDFCKDPAVVALGEMGLDFFRDYAPAEAQHEVFTAQLDLARACRSPVVIHSRAADRETLHHLASYQEGPVVMHCFSGTVETAQTCARLGYYIGVGGVLTFPSARELRDIVRSYPRDQVLLETDCPFLAPQAKRGKRNEPGYLPWVVEALAGLWDMPPQEAAAITAANAVRVFQPAQAERTG